MPSILLSELPNEGISSGSNFIKHFYLQHFVTTHRKIFCKCIIWNLIELYFYNELEEVLWKSVFPECLFVYFLGVYLCISWVCICVFANKGEVGPSVQCLNSNEWWGGGYPPHPSMLLKERIKEKESILEFVFLLKVDFNCNVTSLAQYPITGVSTSLSLMSSNNRVEYSAGCILFSYHWICFIFHIFDAANLVLISQQQKVIFFIVGRTWGCCGRRLCYFWRWLYYFVVRVRAKTIFFAMCRLEICRKPSCKFLSRYVNFCDLVEIAWIRMKNCYHLLCNLLFAHESGLGVSSRLH